MAQLAGNAYLAWITPKGWQIAPVRPQEESFSTPTPTARAAVRPDVRSNSLGTNRL